MGWTYPSVCSVWFSFGAAKDRLSWIGCHLLASNVSPGVFAEGEAGKRLLRKHPEALTESVPALVFLSTPAFQTGSGEGSR